MNVVQWKRINDCSCLCHLSPQIRIRACDGGNLCAVTVATISIRTNFQPPQFSPLPANYQRTVPETITLGVIILDLNATDADPTVRHSASDSCVMHSHH